MSLELDFNIKTITSDCFNYVLNTSDKFDIIFLDPPYREKAIDKILELIIKNKILKNNGIIIIHRHKKETDTFPENFYIIDEKKYGISKIIFGSYL